MLDRHIQVFPISTKSINFCGNFELLFIYREILNASFLNLCQERIGSVRGMAFLMIPALQPLLACIL